MNLLLSFYHPKCSVRNFFRAVAFLSRNIDEIASQRFQGVAFAVDFRRVRTPSRLNSGTGGHHPCTACRSKNAPTTVGNANQRRSTVAPSVTPINEAVAALASRV